MSTATPSAILSVRQKRLSLQREADLLEQEEKGLINSLIDTLVKGGTTSYTDGELVAYLSSTEEPVANDWPKLLDYIVDNGAVDLLQKRVTASAVKARWADGEIIPGVEPVTKYSIKFNV